MASIDDASSYCSVSCFFFFVVVVVFVLFCFWCPRVTGSDIFI